MDIAKAAPPADAAPAARLAFLHGPDWMTDPVDAVLSSVVLPCERLPEVQVMIATDGRHAVGHVNGNELWSIAIPRQRWLEILTGQIVATITALLRRLVFVHAGVVEIDGRAWVLVGDSGAGKTSTVAALLACGGAYLSDEVALLDPETGNLVPFPLPMAIKPWTARACGPFPPGTHVARQGAVVFRRPVRLGRSCPLGTLVLLEPEGRPAVHHVSRAQALLRLARQPSSFQHAGRTDDAFHAWARALRSTQCIALAGRRPAGLARVVMERSRRSERVAGP
jgi:hypothetical protein